ncbi:hypothetical protein [Amycolatopsis sp. NPDC051061]|uniref:hypothetical protein n=1 Tax=Amycolatopsis sp. NPDC051061 TaxID=3155042 RepID=UPI003439A6EC
MPGRVPLYIWETRPRTRHEHDPPFTAGPRRGPFRGLGDASFLMIPWWEEFVDGNQLDC